MYIVHPSKLDTVLFTIALTAARTAEYIKYSYKLLNLTAICTVCLLIVINIAQDSKLLMTECQCSLTYTLTTCTCWYSISYQKLPNLNLESSCDFLQKFEAFVLLG